MTSSKHDTLPTLTRRSVLAACSAAGVAHTLFPGALLAMLSQSGHAKPHDTTAPEQQQSASADLRGWPAITSAMIDAAAAIAAVHLSEEQRAMMLNGLIGQRNSALRVRELHLANSVAPAVVTNPVPAGTTIATASIHTKVTAKDLLSPASSTRAAVRVGADNLEAAAFLSVRELGSLLREGHMLSVALTRMYLARLKRYDPKLHCVITLTEDRALKQAAERDRELHASHDRGPLHGIPWGAKDLLAVAGYPTTWGAAGFEKQAFDEDAEVVKRLDASGAVLVAKLSMGALAQGDLWFGGRTRNPWNTKQGSSGSSAGSASAVAAGCVGFAIGTETLGSISSPSTRCGATGLRPSFGVVPRTGAMALSWSMDKIGPLARSVEDCLTVLMAIAGPDGKDMSCQAAPPLSVPRDLRKLRVGFLKSAFDTPEFQPLPATELAALEASERSKRETQHRADFERQHYDAQFATATLQTLRAMGVTLVPTELPSFHFSALLNILGAEAAAAFDDLLLSGRDALLTGQKPWDWPNQFRTSRFLPAVDYIQAQRARTLAMRAMHDFFQSFDVIVCPSGGTQLTATNLCGQPAVIVPNGFRGSDAPPPPNLEEGSPDNVGGPGTPVSITFLAPLHGEAQACALAAAYQERTGFHLRHPQL